MLREFVSVIEEGQLGGQIRPVDARVAALGIIGMCNWVAWWHKPGQGDEAVAAQLADMAVASLAEQADRAGEGEEPARAVSSPPGPRLPGTAAQERELNHR